MRLSHANFPFLDKIKPPIAHRDINTANILVKNDLTCVIADFGFSMTTMGSKIFRNGHRENAEQFSLTDVSKCIREITQYGFSMIPLA